MPHLFSIYRLARYCLHLAEMFKTNRVVPAVIFLKPGGYPEELRLSGDHGEYLTFRFIVNDLKKTPAEKFMKSANIVARLNLPNMAYDPGRKVEVYASAQDGLVELEKDINKRLKYLEFIDYYAKLSEEELIRYKEEHLPKSSRKEEIMGLRKMFHEEGKQEGKREGRISLFRLILMQRFGAIPDWTEDRLKDAGQKDIERWAIHYTEASTIEEIFEGQSS